MITYSVLYPYVEGKRFDMDYYCNKHVPMVRSRLGESCKGIVIQAGMAGLDPGSKPTYVAMAHLFFDSVESYRAAFAPHVPEFRADIPNYTDIEPTRQISESKLHVGMG